MPSLVALAAFLPYVSPGIALPSQVQPWAALLAWAGLFLAPFRGLVVTLRYSHLIILALSLYYLFYIYPDGSFDAVFYMRKSMVFLLSFSIMVYARYIGIAGLRRALLIAAVVYTAFAVLQYASTSAYVAIAGKLTELTNIHIGERGAASLAPEATDFGLTMVYLLTFALVLAAVDTARGRAVLGMTGYRIVILLALVCIVLSKSGTGFVGLAVVAALAFSSVLLRRRNVLLLVLAVAGTVLIAALLPESLIENLRGLRLIRTILTDPSELIATSFAHRIVHNIVGVIAMFESGGLGYGSGSFISVGPEIYDRYGFANSLGLSTWHQASVRVTLGTGALGVVPMLLAEYGVFGLLLIWLVFREVWRSRIPYRWAVLALMAMTWMQSFPAAYPMFWLFVGLARHPTIGLRRVYMQPDSGPMTVVPT